MATWTVNFYPFNILETGTVTITGGTDTGYPESRIYDREKSLVWKHTNTSQSRGFAVDQGAGVLTSDILIVENHNFDGLTCYFQDSENGSDYDTIIDSWVQSGNGQIIKTVSAPVVSQYFRLYVQSTVNPYCGEVYISLEYSFNAYRQNRPSGSDVDNVFWNKSQGNIERSTKFGETRRARSYTFFLSASELTSFQAVVTYTDGLSKPFYIKDHDGDYYIVRFASPPNYDYSHDDYTQVSVNLIEML